MVVIVALLAAMVDGKRPEHEMVHVLCGVAVANYLKTDRVILPPCVAAVKIVRARNRARWEGGRE